MREILEHHAIDRAADCRGGNRRSPGWTGPPAPSVSQDTPTPAELVATAGSPVLVVDEPQVVAVAREALAEPVRENEPVCLPGAQQDLVGPHGTGSQDDHARRHHVAIFAEAARAHPIRRSTTSCGESLRRSVTPSASAMCRCCRPISPRPTASSWPASQTHDDPPLQPRAVAAGFSLAGLSAYSGVHEVDKNSRRGGGDRSRRRRCVHRDRPGRSRSSAAARAQDDHRRRRHVHGRQRTSSRAGTARQAPSATARATGNASTGPTSSTTRCPRRRRSLRSSRPIRRSRRTSASHGSSPTPPCPPSGARRCARPTGPAGADRCRQPRGASAEQSLTVSESFRRTRGRPSSPSAPCDRTPSRPGTRPSPGALRRRCGNSRRALRPRDRVGRFPARSG